MLSNFLLPCKCELKRGNTCVSQKIAADGLDKVKFFPRSERYETHADLSRASEEMLKKTLNEMKAYKNESFTCQEISFDALMHILQKFCRELCRQSML